MDYQEAIETLQDIHDVAEIRIENGDTRGVVYIPPDKLDGLKTAISAMKELQEYKQLGTLEEVREAVEKQADCKHCGYKIHSENISKLNSCNDCRLKSTCKKRPEYGEYCRINCYDWSKEE